MNNSLLELNARERAVALLDKDTAQELIGPFDNIISPHLIPQNIVPESDDGVIIMKGQLKHLNCVIISIEGSFQGGGIGEVGGAKIVSALEHTLLDNKNGEKVYPLIIFDTGGVRLQEANYGLLSISEIQNMIIELKQYVPVIGLIPGRVGSFGGMSITTALMSYIITTDKARIGLNGPEVIEQEAGAREFDSSDKNLIWNTLGAKQRKATGIVDEVIDDDVDAFRSTIAKTILEKKDSNRDQQVNFYLSLIETLDPAHMLTTQEYTNLYRHVSVHDHHLNSAIPSDYPTITSRGRHWFEQLTQIKNAHSDIPTVLHALVNGYEYISIVPDKNNNFPRVRHGEVGLKEGYTVANVINDLIDRDKDKKTKTPIVIIVDVPSQAYGYNEELVGIHMSLAASVSAYARARQAGHKIISFIPGDAVSGGFLAHGLQSNRLIALNDSSITIQAMSKESAARITNRSLQELEQATKNTPAMAYDIKNYQKLGSLFYLISNVKSYDSSDYAINIVKNAINSAISDLENKPTDLSFRYNNKIAKESGRVATNKIRLLMDKQWN
ncbi:biotin-independent malonate decarboxylase subunit beta [Ligilactobacillus sp. WILCCON 0076]|uniref:Biotin-independent malonate decarboxylase subunit beta n=1 Tax=Ligilactobacillus ubinensis TaxID=2876789 RepID=A0A9X2JMN9_9LACO|nr:biotin-independent malonate decarboxylase subunit beta [Ligilactobacillus ubinensis]MCP0887775.1 biotin-independent malonate decarboxylase subunit beta [Ligilactobacillus ubinensis]